MYDASWDVEVGGAPYLVLGWGVVVVIVAVVGNGTGVGMAQWGAMVVVVVVMLMVAVVVAVVLVAQNSKWVGRWWCPSGGDGGGDGPAMDVVVHWW